MEEEKNFHSSLNHDEDTAPLMRRTSTFREAREERQQMRSSEQGYSEEAKSTARSKACRDLFSSLLFFSVTLGLTVERRDAAAECTIPLVTWLLVASMIYLSSALKCLAQLCIINSTNNPKNIQVLEIFYYCIVVNFELAWLIYGNTFVYSEAAMTCKNLNDSTKGLWILMVIIIAFGYLLFFLYCMLACCCSIFVCILCCVPGSSADFANLPGANHIPLIDVLKSLHKQKYSELNDKEMTQCVICMENFGESDEVAFANCDQRHYFHTPCYEDWIKNNPVCPLCKKPITPE